MGIYNNLDQKVKTETKEELEEYLEKKSLAKVTGGGSVLSRYQEVVVGSKSFLKLLYFEFCIWLAKIPGSLGLFLRKIFWPRLFGSCGKAVFFGNNITLRHPNRIFLGSRVVISDGCVLDARSPELEKVIVIEDDVILSNNVFLQCKGGSISIGSHSGLNTSTVVSSTDL
jgi:galactoside O-acetyltransferase